MLTMQGNRVLTTGRCFEVGSNIGPRFTFGSESQHETWLHAEFVGEGKNEPLFNGRLFHSAGDGQTTVIDNFPKSEVPNGWTKRVRTDANGYELIDGLGQVIFSYWDTGDGHVKVTLKLYGAGGQLVAYTDENSLKVSGLSFSM